jgi:Fe2+ transport system protein FeoA
MEGSSEYERKFMYLGIHKSSNIQVHLRELAEFVS